MTYLLNVCLFFKLIDRPWNLLRLKLLRRISSKLLTLWLKGSVIVFGGPLVWHSFVCLFVFNFSMALTERFHSYKLGLYLRMSCISCRVIVWPCFLVLSFKKNIYSFRCVWGEVSRVYVNTQHVWWSPRDQESVSYPVEWEIKIASSCHMGVRNQTWAFWKNKDCWPLRHISNHDAIVFIL